MDIGPTLSIIWFTLYLILALIDLIFILAILKIRLLKQPTNPLRLIRTTNVRVSGLTESSGTSFGQH